MTGANLSSKICSKCKQNKPLIDFGKNKSQKFGHSNYCKLCAKEYSDQWTTPEKLKRKYEARSSPEKLRKHKSKVMFKKYGITLEQYELLWKSQGECCKICKTTENSKGKSFAIDHCHKSGKVRGILCDNCNHILGKAKDDPKVLDEASAYLKSNLVVG